MWVLPNRLFYADHFTMSAKKMFTRMAIGFLGLAAGLLSTGLVDSENWPEVLGGALLAWGVSIIIWAISSYRRERDEIRTDLRRTAELDLLHARLNQIAARVGAPLLVLDYQLEPSVGARMERLAHFAGLDEFREEAHTTEDGYAFWTQEALGYEASETTERPTDDPTG
jgi:hypothetical protein